MQHFNVISYILCHFSVNMIVCKSYNCVICASVTAIARKVVRKNVHGTIPKGVMGYAQYTVPDTKAVEPIFVAFF